MTIGQIKSTTKMISRSMNGAGLSLVLLTLALCAGNNAEATIGAKLGVIGAESIMNGALGALPNMMNSATNMMSGLTAPVMGAVGSLSGGLQSGLTGVLSSSLGGVGTLTGGEGGLIGNSMRLTSGALSGLTTGLTSGFGGLAAANNLESSFTPQINSLRHGGIQAINGMSVNNALASAGAMSAANNMAAANNIAAANNFAAANTMAGQNMLLRNNYKREAITEGLMGATGGLMAGAAAETAARASHGAAHGLMAGAAAAGQAMANTALAGTAMAGQAMANSALAAPAMAGQAMANSAMAGRAMANSALAGPAMASQAMAGTALAGQAMANSAFANPAMMDAEMANPALAGPAMMGAAMANPALAGPAMMGPAMADSAIAASAGAAANAAFAQGPLNTALLAAGPQSSPARQALAADAIRSAQAESAAAGAGMLQHGTNNARSASIASNAYRQAKLASARDRVNVAGTIQNSARISDAAIATHDAATKAEDSLLGSELAVDSAATVFDSDGAYIPPVTASLLRSLPYGRLGLRNIIPKPLTHPSVMLPDVWLNGVPVNYQNIPLRMLPYGIGPAKSINSLMFSQAAAADGAIINRQPFVSNNGLLLNGLVFDPAYAFMGGANYNGIVGNPLLPIMANVQQEAQDELAMAHLFNMQQLNGVGMPSTYQGYGRLNPVPMITGSVSDINITPTTTIGTTYPIGSALVIEPRDSFFQDYTDSASSRQNFDERQQ